jgi:hypothetical protein
MIDTQQDIDIKQVNTHFEATIPGIGVTVTGATHDEALTNALRAINLAMIEEAEKRKRQGRKDHTGA